MSALIETMIASGELSPAARDMHPYDVLHQWGEVNAIKAAKVTFAGPEDETHVETMSWNDRDRRIILYNTSRMLVLCFDAVAPARSLARDIVDLHAI